MSSLVQDDLTRASSFFALAFVLTAVGGFLIGDLRTGIEWGLMLGVAFAAFAYFFIKPTGDQESTEEVDEETTSPETDPVASEE